MARRPQIAARARRAGDLLALGVKLLLGVVLVTLVLLLVWSGAVGGAEVVVGWVGRFASGTDKAAPPARAVAAFLRDVGPAAWATEVATLGLVQLGMLGAALALRAGAHQGVDALTRILPTPVERATDLGTRLVIAGFGGVFAWAGALYVLDAHARGGTLDTAPFVPKWPFYLCYPLAGVLFVLFSIESIVRIRLGGEDLRPSLAEPSGEKAGEMP